MKAKHNGLISRVVIWMLIIVVSSSQMGLWPGSTLFAAEEGEGDPPPTPIERTIVEIPSITVETQAGIAPVLPSVVQAVYSDSSFTEVNVNWDSIDASRYLGPGTFTVEGEAEGTDLKAEAHVVVYEAEHVFDSFLKEIESNIPEGQELVTYSNNYQSMEPEPMTFHLGNGSTSVNNGLTVDIIALDKNASIATWDKAPWLSVGTIDTTMRYKSGVQSNVGFVIGTYDDKPSVSVRYDAGTTWVIQSPDGTGDWETFTGPELKLDTDYHIQIGFNRTKLLVVVDGQVYYNQECKMLGTIADYGQVGVYKRYATGKIEIKDIKIIGAGMKEKPSDIVSYVQDYEDPAYVPNWSGLNAQVVTEQNGNKVLSLKKGSKERGADLDSPPLQKGTLSLDFKLVNPAKLGNGQGFAFGFRMNDEASIFNELGVDPSSWIPESSSGWGSKLNIPYPIQGRWNNLMFNFNEKTITVYMNKKLIGDISFDQFTEAAGRFGMRIRSTVELYIDNLQYTNQIIEPEQIVQYSNDFQEGITGRWSDATAAIVAEGSNRILHLTNMNGEAWNLDAPQLPSATYMLEVKPTTTAIGFTIGDHAAIRYEDGKWVLKQSANSIDLVTVKANDSTPKVRAWNKVGLQYTDSSITLSINGAELHADLPAGTQFGLGGFGIIAEGQIYVDNILFTEQFPELDTNIASDKIIYEEYYESLTDLNWTGLGEQQVADGYLQGTIAASTAAMNQAVQPIANGEYQVKMKVADGVAGVKIGNTTIYQDSGKWVSQLDGSGSKTVIGTAPNLEGGKEYLIRVQLIENEWSLYVNGTWVGSASADGFQQGAFGIYNPGTREIQVSIDAITVEEIRIYIPDYTTPSWVALDESKAEVLNSGEDFVQVNMPGVALMADKASPKVANQRVAFDFQTSATPGADGGRYGFVLRGLDSERYVSIIHDINGKWMLYANGNETKFPVTYEMKAASSYKVELRLAGNTVSFSITDSEGVKTDMGSVTDEEITQEAGWFGLRSWYGSKTMTVSNLKIVEIESMPKLQLTSDTDTITKDGLTVTLYQDFPGIANYQLGDRTISTGMEQTNTLIINNTEYKPQTTSKKVAEHKYEYTMNIEEIGVEITAQLQIEESHVVRFEVTNIKEGKDVLVRSIQLNSSLIYVDSSMDSATYAWNKSNGEWHGISEELVDDMLKMKQAGTFGATMTMASANGLGIAVENNVISSGNKMIVTTEKKPLVNKISVKPGTWTYRHSQSNETEALPWYEVVITEEQNGDGKTDWQDAVVAYRKTIFVEPYGAEDMKNSMMYIAFNFASQANDTFLNSLDTGKVLYNYTDGFGQMILHKGYQAEGHDDDIPSYSNIGVRQGGLKDFNYLIDEGDKYNLRVGVHINATEYHLDANELNYSNLNGATANGPATDKLGKGWDWIDTAYYVDQTKDVLSGDLKARFESLYNLTKDPNNPNDPALDFYYIDVYTGNDYNAHKLLQYANDLGLKVGTEFAGPLEPGVDFVHWGPDLGYPNKGNNSTLSRMVKNNLDIFVGQALYKGQKIPGVTTWGDSKPDLQQGVTVFFNEVLPTKYMQHFGVLKHETDQVTYEDGVISKRNKGNGKIELSKDGKLISSWKDTGTTTDESVRHTGEANSLIPWVWDVRTNKVLGMNEGAKLYHWNTTGKETTWQLTNEFKDVKQFNMYELTQQGKVLVDTINAVNGTITIDRAAKNTPYVLYPASADAEKLVPSAQDWGAGSLIKDFAFNSERFNVPGSWTVDDTNHIKIKTVQGDAEYDISKEMTNSNWNRYAEVGSQAGEISQRITGLIPGQDYTVGVWTQTQKGRKSGIQVVIGDETYTNEVTGADGSHQTSFKYVNTTWQRMSVEFHVPEGVTEATVKLVAEAGAGTVSYDDVRIWQHITVEDDVTNKGYVVYEDFENVYEGWGPFEYGGGSRKIHIASDRSNALDNNPVVKPSEQKVGPVMTWVLDGENSLKINETDVGRLIKSNEAGVKLQPNQEYELGFIYTLENLADYEVLVQSRSTGEVVLQEQLEHLPNPGNKPGKDGGYIEFKQIFTTGEQDDYQVLFKLVSKREEKATSDCALILDNFYIKGYGIDYSKTLLQQVIDRAGKLNSKDYKPESWATLTAALDKAIAVMKDPAATIALIDESRVVLEQAIKQLIPSAGIVKIDPVTVDTRVGIAPVLPETVKATYENDQTKEVAVTWNAIDPSQYAQEGSFQVEGAVNGTAIKAVATVNVKRNTVTPDPEPRPDPVVNPSPEVKPEPGQKPDPGQQTDPDTKPDPGTDKPKPFADTVGHWASKEIDELVRRGIVKGISATEFAPNKTVSRAELSAMFARALDLKPGGSTSFLDVADNMWYTDDIAAASQAGLIKGYAGNKFEPMKSITRQETAVIMMRVLELEGKSIKLSDTADHILAKYKDAAQVSKWSQEALAISIQAGLMQGTPDHKLHPNGNLTRAEAAVLLTRLLQHLEQAK